MRIVDVNEFYSPTGGGVRTYLERKMGLMAEMGHELIVIAPGRENQVEERPGGGRIIFVKAPRLPFDHNYGLFWDAAPITALLDELNPDVVENCSPWRSAWIVGNWQGDALKSHFMHNDNVSAYFLRWFESVISQERLERSAAWYTRYMARFLDKFDVVVTNGPALEKRLRARGLRIDAAMPLGIERGHFSPALRDERLRAAMLAQCGLPPEGHLLVGLGRHHREKRWDVVIDAVERAGASMPVGLILLGTGVETRNLEKRLAGSPHIRLFRPVYDRERLARIMASCDALIHGSEGEPFGPDIGGCAEVADPLSAETYAARDAAAAARAIARLFAREPAMLRRAAVAAAGRVRSDREHTVELMDYYAARLAEKRAARLCA